MSLASQVRRIILTGLPSTWATPTKVLSLIHGGAIEKVSITPSGNAHVLFCEHEDCKAFYDKYPNGIGIGPHNVFVEMGQEVDVVSSQLTLNRSVGSTRVVRAVGVDLGITMVELNQLASGSNRKVEKILDNYSPDEVRFDSLSWNFAHANCLGSHCDLPLLQPGRCGPFPFHACSQC